MSIFALNYTYGGPPEILAEHRPAHRAFLRRLHESGVNLASGPLGDDGALIVLRADGADEVLLFVVDILREEATLLVPNPWVAGVATRSFGVPVTGDTVVLPGIVSRKKQIIPALKV